MVKNGFRKCGLFPWKPSKVDFSKIPQIEENIQEVPLSAKEQLFPENVNFRSGFAQFELFIGKEKLATFKEVEGEWNGENSDLSLFLVWKQWSAQVKENSQKEDVQDGLLDNNDDDFLFDVLELQDDLGVQESGEDVLTQDSFVEVNADVVVHNFQDEELDSNQMCVVMDPENINDDATNVDINSFEIFVLAYLLKMNRFSSITCQFLPLNQ